MYDGINSLVGGIHSSFSDAALVAGYINGRYAWSQADWNLFPHSIHVEISVTSSGAGDVLDVENGDATPEEGYGWIERRKAAGLDRPTIYCSRSVVPAVRAATGKFILNRDYDLWVADYTGKAHSLVAAGPGAELQVAAVQHTNTAKWDISTVYDDGWPHRTGTAAKSPVKVSAGSAWTAGMELREGSSGPAVKALQTALNDTHLVGVRNITVDGIFGSQTETSLKNYQSHMGLSVDGVAGPQTRQALGVY